MAKVLITGMSGTGKSTVLTLLAARGHRTVDTDTDRWSRWAVPLRFCWPGSPRTGNPYGKRPAERAAILEHLAVVEPLLRATATAEIDARAPAATVARQIETLAAAGRPDAG